MQNEEDIGVKYTIKTGDSLYKIAKAYGISVSSLKFENSLSTDLIFAGKVINIPITQASSQKIAIKDIISGRGLNADKLVIRLFVDKSDKLLTVYNGDTMK